MPCMWKTTHHSLCLLQAKFWVGLVLGEQQDDGYAASWQGLAAVHGLLRPPHCAAAKQHADMSAERCHTKLVECHMHVYK